MVLASERAAAGPATVELRSAGGEVLWTGTGLQPGPLGGFTLGLPTSLLGDGTYTLTLRPARGTPETYSIRIERTP
jgi:hypothetical protein